MTTKKELIKQIKQAYPIELDTKKLNTFGTEELEQMLKERLEDIKLLIYFLKNKKQEDEEKKNKKDKFKEEFKKLIEAKNTK